MPGWLQWLVDIFFGPKPPTTTAPPWTTYPPWTTTMPPWTTRPPVTTQAPWWTTTPPPWNPPTTQPPWTTTMPPWTTRPPVTTPGPAGWLQEMLAAHNEERSKAGLSALSLDMDLCRAAQGHTDWMVRTGTLSHTGEGGSSFSDRCRRAGYAGFPTGENIAMGYQTVETVMTGWMGSTGHRQNILSSRSTQVGFGMAVAGNGYRYWTADFGVGKASFLLGEEPPVVHLSGPFVAEGVTGSGAVSF